MDKFTFYTPTRVIFGKGAEDNVGKLIKDEGGTKVLIHYGSNSVIKSGLLEKVKQSLEAEGLKYVELGGVVPNPRLSKVYEGIELSRREGVDFILAVGGGSVLDSAKAISIGVPYEGDVWDFYNGKKPNSGIKHGNIITLAATGSEMSSSSVITKDDGKIKKGANFEFFRPVFTCMNPESLYTLPPYQTSCGIVDILMHTFERFFSKPREGGKTEVSDSIAVAIMRTVIEYGPICLVNPEDYEARSEIMWAGSLSHNDLTGLGRVGDWATHRIEHELSAMYDVAHGAGLAAVWGSWARYVVDENVTRFAKFGVDVWDLSLDYENPMNTALAAIKRTEDFFKYVNMPITITELIGRKPTDEELRECARKCMINAPGVGSMKTMTEESVYEIYKAAI